MLKLLTSCCNLASMCGIAGLLSSSSKDSLVDSSPVSTQLSAMLEALQHRGPDGLAFYRDQNFEMGMRRLSINDLKTGDQPFFSNNGDIVVMYNGEIYNSPELRRGLKDVHFRGHSDGEVIAHLYPKYGEKLFEKLDGMYAIALWVKSEKKLILARDIPGEKPLYYSALPRGGLAFASELKSLLKHPEVSKKLDRQAVWDLPTFLWVPDPDTILTEVKCLRPGQILIHTDRGSSFQNIENKFGPDRLPRAEAEVIELVRHEVTQAVKSRLLSDVPVGSFLSGGLDSSIIAKIAQQELGEISTFTVGFEDLDDPYHGRSDESGVAAEFATLIGTKHETIRVSSDTVSSHLDQFCAAIDQPMGVSSGMGILFVSEAARRKNIKVLLSGDGADENFGGYSWYPYLSSREGSQDGEASFQSVGLSAAARAEKIKGYDDAKRAWAYHYYASEADKKSLMRPLAEMSSSLRHFSQWKSTPWEAVDFIRQDRDFYFPNEMLRKVDRLTMANSVEGRAPFAAPAIKKLAGLLSMSQMIQGRTLKSVLRRAFDGILPRELIERPKHGFNFPVDHWLKTTWAGEVEECFSSRSALSRFEIIDSNSLAVAREMLNNKEHLHGHTILTLICLNKWLEKNL